MSGQPPFNSTVCVKILTRLFISHKLLSIWTGTEFGAVFSTTRTGESASQWQSDDEPFYWLYSGLERDCFM